MTLSTLAAAVLALAQEDFLPLGEGHRWTYSIEDRAPEASASPRESVCEARGPRKIGTEEWTEVANFLGYPSCFLRSTAEGVDFKLEAEDAAPSLTILKLPFREGETWKGSLGRDGVSFTAGAQERVETAGGIRKAYRVSFTVGDSRRAEAPSPTHGDLWFSPGVGLVRAQLTKDLDCHSGTTTTYLLKE
jgi:hypothetical protein